MCLLYFNAVSPAQCNMVYNVMSGPVTTTHLAAKCLAAAPGIRSGKSPHIVSLDYSEPLRAVVWSVPEVSCKHSPAQISRVAEGSVMLKQNGCSEAQANKSTGAG